MGVYYEASDGSRRNPEGIGYALAKGQLKPEDIESLSGGVVIRGTAYARVE